MEDNENEKAKKEEELNKLKNLRVNIFYLGNTINDFELPLYLNEFRTQVKNLFKIETRTNDDRTGVLKAPVNTQKIPGIIWEVAFVDSKKGRQRLKSNSTMNEYTNTMVKTIVEYFDMKNGGQKQQQIKLIRKTD